MEGVILEVLNDKCVVDINREVFICFIKGNLRKNKILPLPGDRVIIDKDMKIIKEILPRKNKLIRPKVCNITKAIVVASLKEPDLDTNLIDKILVELEFNKIKPIICFTKKDLLSELEFRNIEYIINYYKSLYPVYFNNQIDDIKKIFKGEISVFIGQSGAGKTTLINKLDENFNFKTNEISKVLGRGKHTTRHVYMLPFNDGFILDSPGFSALEFPNMLKKEIKECFIDFRKYSCKYQDCMHIKEMDCKIKEKVMEGTIPKFRYENYLNLLKSAYSDEEKYKRRSL